MLRGTYKYLLPLLFVLAIGVLPLLMPAKLFGPIILLLASVTSLIIARSYWRGTLIDDHPVCRRCAYDLIGTPEPHKLCPECGADLKLSKAILIGNRKRKPVPALVAGTLGLLCSIALVSFLVIVVSHTNFNPYKPFWMLKLEATTPALDSKGGALDELLNRTRNGSLSTFQLDGLMNATLQVQADTSIPWDPTWGDLFAELFTQGVGTAQQHEQYADLIYNYSLEVRPRVRLGSPIVLQTHVYYNRGNGEQTEYESVHSPVSVTTGGATGQFGQHWSTYIYNHSWTGRSSSSMTGRSDAKIPTASPPFDALVEGTHQLTCTQQVEIRIGGDKGPLVKRFTLTQTAPIMLLSPHTSEIELYTDPAFSSEVEAQIRIDKNEIRVYQYRDFAEATVRIYNQSPFRTTFCYRLSARTDEGEWPLDLTYWYNAKTKYTGMNTLADWPADLTVDHIDLVFRPDPDVARQTVDIYRILDHEFVIKDVEVARQP